MDVWVGISRRDLLKIKQLQGKFHTCIHHPHQTIQVSYRSYDRRRTDRDIGLFQPKQV